MTDQPNGMSPEAVKNGTGKDWAEWVKILDAVNATSMDHKGIAKYVLDNYDLSGWWAQGVAIGYEHEKGMRPKGMTSDGFAANASKTLAVPLERLWQLWADDDLRAQWLDPDLVPKSTATENKALTRNGNAHDSARSAIHNPKGYRLP